ncbi:MAG: ABC transporter substrate-binding protein, partial [Okeania sp. SIO2H7]|nr:ABC transporter substrate-binding protein [Okeania sp. SIO2H7]
IQLLLYYIANIYVTCKDASAHCYNSPQIDFFLPFSLERLSKLEPDVIFISSDHRNDDNTDTDTDIEEYLNYSDSPLWQGLTAVKNQRVYGANPLKIMAFGTRGLGTLLDITMPKIYPDVFSE